MTTSRVASLLSTPKRVARDWPIADCLCLVEVLHAANVLTSCRLLALLYKLGIRRIPCSLSYPNLQAVLLFRDSDPPYKNPHGHAETTDEVRQ